jgi:hypothetical protein
MAKLRNHPDLEYRRFRQKYPRFPGVAECVRLIKARKARRAWADFIVLELAEHASACWQELLETFFNEPHGDVRLYIMMALEEASLPQTVPFLAEVLDDGDERLVPYAVRALKSINTPESRKELWNRR